MANKVVTNVGAKMSNNIRAKGRPKHVMCFDNDVVVLIGASNDGYHYYVSSGKLLKSKNFPKVGKKIPWFRLTKEQRTGVLKYYEPLWTGKRARNISTN